MHFVCCFDSTAKQFTYQQLVDYLGHLRSFADRTSGIHIPINSHFLVYNFKKSYAAYLFTYFSFYLKLFAINI